ncbi:hypothetical protein EYF80_019454 [Liparis tanakae]|uniref:Uncharacterized protein n=1 Tax=Liparis tanakae TaxID=230148 RepID=A0A4Z2HXH3_9TELE|nr:hypothetical protein EYF80_019454 [Liparis tanakae]
MAFASLPVSAPSQASNKNRDDAVDIIDRMNISYIGEGGVLSLHERRLSVKPGGVWWLRRFCRVVVVLVVAEAAVLRLQVERRVWEHQILERRRWRKDSNKGRHAVGSLGIKRVRLQHRGLHELEDDENAAKRAGRVTMTCASGFTGDGMWRWIGTSGGASSMAGGGGGTRPPSAG